MTIIKTPNIQKPKVVSVLPEKHNIVYASCTEAWKSSHAFALLCDMLARGRGPESMDLLQVLHRSQEVTQILIPTTWLWGWWKMFIWLSMTSMKSQVILRKLKIFITAYAWWRSVSRPKSSSCATCSESEGSWNLADVIIYLSRTTPGKPSCYSASSNMHILLHVVPPIQAC